MKKISLMLAAALLAMTAFSFGQDMAVSYTHLTLPTK